MKLLFRAIANFFKKADMLLLGLCICTSLFGIVMISSATASLGATRYVAIQITALILGVALYVLMTYVDIDIIADQRELLFLFNVAFIATLFLWGVEGTSGNRSWLAFSWLPFNIQPAEFCKITFIIIMAKTMSIYRDRVSSLRCVGLTTIHMLMMVVLIIVASYDTGTALVYVVIFAVMAYTGGVNLIWFLLGLAGIAAVSPYLWNSYLREDQKNRILMIFDASIDPDGLGVRYQTRISLNYFKNGGLSGQGLFSGNQTQAYILPAQHTDFIFSTIGEELGVIGCVVVMILLFAIIVRCVWVGIQSKNYMNRCICIGIASMLTIQILINIGMCIGLFPVIGLTLPFISYGGSSLVTTFIAMGIVSGIHMRPAPDGNARYIHPNYGAAPF